MTSVILQPPRILSEVRVHLPASKSISNRLLITSAIHQKEFPITNLSVADDTRLMQALLSEIKTQKAGTKSAIINCNNAGTVFRFLTALLSVTSGDWILTGTRRMMKRPIRILVEALQQLGADIDYPEQFGYPPLHIIGKPLNGGEINIDGSVSSQYISALLMIAPVLKGGLSISLNAPPVSQTYIEMTLRLMEMLGIEYEQKNKSIFIAEQELTQHPINVEPDWSSAAFWYSIAALSGSDGIFLKGLTNSGMQGDARIADVFKALGVETRYSPEWIQLLPHKTEINHFEYDFTACPDLVQATAICCAGLNIPARLTGVKNLRIKETDRLFALETELKKLGYHCHVDAEDALSIEQMNIFNNPISTTINTYDDHRMAMAFACLGILHPGLKIENPAVVSKSYPGFWDDLKSFGFKIDECKDPFKV